MGIASERGEVRKIEFEQWMREYETAVLRACFLYLGDRALAEDAMQDTFIKVWRSMDRFERRNNCSVKSWIMRVAINTCKDYRRSAWFRRVDKSMQAGEALAAPSGVERESRELYLDVLRLPDKYKRAVLLYYYHNMTMEEAARVLGISRPALSRRLKKACACLRCPPEGSDLDGE